jgi:multiple sugar transport system permease protein
MDTPAVTVLTSNPARVSRPGRRRIWRRMALLARYATLTLISIVFAFPFYWVVLTSLLPSDHVFDFPPRLIPRWDFANYSTAWHAADWPHYFLNTAVVACGTTALVLVTSTLSGFCLATMVFPGKRTALAIIFTSIIMPAVVAIIPDYVIANWLGWLNTYWVQIVPWGASTFGIFLLQQFFRSLPTELWDAARIDGCSRLRFMGAIAVPLAGPALATVALFTFLGSYNSLLWPLVMTSTNGLTAGVQPIEVGVYSFIGENGTAYNLLCAATVFTTVPVVVLFLLLQRVFVAGVMRTGIKG